MSVSPQPVPLGPQIQLVAWARRTDPLDSYLAASFETYYKLNFKRLVALASALSGDSSLAEEIANEAFTAAYERWDYVGGLDSRDAWFRRVVANKSASSVRRKMVRARGLMKLSASASTNENLRLTVEEEWIWALVRDLPRRQAQVVALTFVECLTLDQVGDVLRISKSAASTHLRRAKLQLRQWIELQGGMP